MGSLLDQLDPGHLFALLGIAAAAWATWLAHRRELRLHDVRLRHERAEKVRGLAAQAYGRIRDHMWDLSGNALVALVEDSQRVARATRPPSIAEVLARAGAGERLDHPGLAHALAAHDARVASMLEDLAVLAAYGWTDAVRHSADEVRNAILRANGTVKDAAWRVVEEHADLDAEAEVVEVQFEHFRAALGGFYDAITAD